MAKANLGHTGLSFESGPWRDFGHRGCLTGAGVQGEELRYYDADINGVAARLAGGGGWRQKAARQPTAQQLVERKSLSNDRDAPAARDVRVAFVPVVRAPSRFVLFVPCLSVCVSCVY